MSLQLQLMLMPASPVVDRKPDPALIHKQPNTGCSPRFPTELDYIFIYLCFLSPQRELFQTKDKMQRLVSTLLVLLLCCCISRSQANRVYVHPFNLFAVENVSCATPHTQTSKPRETHPVAPLDIQVLTSDSRDPSNHSTQRQNVTEKMVVLTTLFNSLGLRLYQALSSKQSGTNTLLSPINAYGSLVTFSMGASKNTTDLFQVFAFDLFSLSTW